MALDVYFSEDIHKQIVGDLVLMVSVVVATGGDLTRLGGGGGRGGNVGGGEYARVRGRGVLRWRR